MTPLSNGNPSSNIKKKIIIINPVYTLLNFLWIKIPATMIIILMIEMNKRSFKILRLVIGSPLNIEVRASVT